MHANKHAYKIKISKSLKINSWTKNPRTCGNALLILIFEIIYVERIDLEVHFIDLSKQKCEVKQNAWLSSNMTLSVI